MSKYVDRFIKQHKEYFRRNKKVIESNDWNDDTQTEDNVEELFDRIKLLSKTDDKESQKEISQLKKEIFSIKSNRAKNKKALFMQENELTDSIVGRLSAFIKETEKTNDRDLKKVQVFIDETIEIISIHLEKCDKYLDYKLDNLTEEVAEEEIELKSEEIRFQNDIFTKKIKIQDTLDNLNITNSIENVSIEFFEGKLATIPMKEILYDMSYEVRRKVDILDVDWDLKLDNGFLINMKKSDIPIYNERKHFFEQDKEVLQFYISEWNKIKYGITIDGYFIHGWLYFHLNYFKTPIKNFNDKIMLPPLRDNEWYWHEILKLAEEKARNKEDAGIFIFGTRRFSKSTCEASFTHYKLLTNPAKNGVLTATNEKDILSITDKLNISLENISFPFYVYTNSRDWKKQVKFGLKEKTGREYKLFYLDVINTDGGSKKGGQKTAGGNPIVFVMDEAGKESFLDSYNAAIPSFESEHGWACTPFYVGTGGDEDLSSEAEKVLHDPQEYRFIEMDWDILEWQIPKEAITWKRRKFGWFIPAQMGQRTGHRKIKRSFSDFLDIKSKELSMITIEQTDWVNNTKICLEKRDKFKKNKNQLQQEKVFYPLDPDECFMSAKKNPFNSEQARKQKEYLTESGLWDRRRQLFIKDNGKLESIISTKELAPYPHKGGTIDAPILIFEDIPDDKPVENLYVATFDDVKQDDSDTDSLISFQIWKMDIMGDEWGDRLVLSWACRPENRKEMYSKWLLLQKAYNAKAFPENEDMGYKVFLEGKHLEDQWLCNAMDFTSSLNITNNGKRKYGWTPRQSKKVLLGMFIDYCNDPVEVEDENGEIKTIFGIQKINDIGLLDEIISFKEDGNFDRISSALGAIGWMHYLKTNWMLPKIKRSTNNDSSKKQIKNIRSFYSTTKQKSLYKK